MSSLRQPLRLLRYTWYFTNGGEQALHEETHLQTCRTFRHLTSISNNRVVHVNLLLMKPTVNSSISSFNCPLLQPAFYAHLLVMLVVKWFLLLNYTKVLPEEHLCVHIKPPGFEEVMKQLG